MIQMTSKNSEAGRNNSNNVQDFEADDMIQMMLKILKQVEMIQTGTSKVAYLNQIFDNIIQNKNCWQT